MEFNECLRSSDSLGQVASDLLRRPNHVVGKVQELEICDGKQSVGDRNKFVGVEIQMPDELQQIDTRN